MTKLNKPVVRQTANNYHGRDIVLTVAPCGAQPETRLGFRLKGKRTQYVVALSDVYRWAAQAYGLKEANAKRTARKLGLLWKIERKKFILANSILA